MTEDLQNLKLLKTKSTCTPPPPPSPTITYALPVMFVIHFFLRFWPYQFACPHFTLMNSSWVISPSSSSSISAKAETLSSNRLAIEFLFLTKILFYNLKYLFRLIFFLQKQKPNRISISDWQKEKTFTCLDELLLTCSVTSICVQKVK